MIITGRYLEHTAHHVVLPIVTIESAVLELLEQWISQADIISYAGVMAKAPNGIPSVHALWGPAAKNKTQNSCCNGNIFEMKCAHAEITR